MSAPATLDSTLTLTITVPAEQRRMQPADSRRTTATTKVRHYQVDAALDKSGDLCSLWDIYRFPCIKRKMEPLGKTQLRWRPLLRSWHLRDRRPCFLTARSCVFSPSANRTLSTFTSSLPPRPIRFLGSVVRDRSQCLCSLWNYDSALNSDLFNRFEGHLIPSLCCLGGDVLREPQLYRCTVEQGFGRRRRRTRGRIILSGR